MGSFKKDVTGGGRSPKKMTIGDRGMGVSTNDDVTNIFLNC